MRLPRWLRGAPLFPFLFVLYLVLNLLANNLGEVDPRQVLRPLLLLSLLTLAGILLLYTLFKDWGYAGYLVFLGLVFIFTFGHLTRLTSTWLPLKEGSWGTLLLLMVWGILLATLGLRRLWIRLNVRDWLPPFLNLTLALALIMPFFMVAKRPIQKPQYTLQLDKKLLPGNFDEQVTIDCSDSPDIYYILVDGYGRGDVLDDLYSLDNTQFLDDLAQRGFYVANQSHTNYIQSIYSISSALNFTYIDPPQNEATSWRYFTQLMAHNRIMSLLKDCGYQSVAFESGFTYSNNPAVDVYLAQESGLNEFESLLLAGSPVDILAGEFELEPSDYNYQAHRRRVRFTLEQLARVPRMRSPKIVFAHILSPHPPFVFDADGRPTEPVWSYSLSDGDEYDGGWETYRQGYTNQVSYLNQKLIQMVDALLAGSSRPPVIIIQGDHGPGGSFHWSSPERACLRERTSILNAYYLPGDGAEALYPGISPVNSFRVVLNAYFEAGLPLLPDDTYFTSHRLPGQAIDITQERDSRSNCAPE